MRAICITTFGIMTVVLAIGCDKKTTPTTATVAPTLAPPPLPVESCDQMAALGTCLDYAKKDAIHQQFCEQTKAKFAAGPCPKVRLIGSCTLEEGDIKRYYVAASTKDPTHTPESAKENCEGALLKGKFSLK